MVEAFEQPPEGQAYHATLHGSVVSAILLVAALLLYLLTGASVLSIAVACSKLGWEDLATAVWLWRKDPRIPRGRTSFLFYLSIALVRVFGATFAMVIAVTSAARFGGIRAPAMGRFQAGAMILSTQALVLLIALMTTSWAALVCALYYHLRPWTDKTVHQLRGRAAGPPRIFHANTAPWVFHAAVWSSVVVLPTVYVQFMEWLGDPLKGDIFPTLFVFLSVFPVAYLYVRPRINADMPPEYWPEDEPSWEREPLQ